MSRFYKYNSNNFYRKCLVAYINKASLVLNDRWRNQQVEEGLKHQYFSWNNLFS